MPPSLLGGSLLNILDGEKGFEVIFGFGLESGWSSAIKGFWLKIDSQLVYEEKT